MLGPLLGILSFTGQRTRAESGARVIVKVVRHFEVFLGDGMSNLRVRRLAATVGKQRQRLVLLGLVKKLSANLDAKQLCKHTGHGVAYLPLDRGNATRHLMILWEGLQGAQLLCG